MLTTTEKDHKTRDDRKRMVRVQRPGRSTFLGQFLGHDSQGNRMVKKPNGKVTHFRKEASIKEVLEIVERSNFSREYVVGNSIR